jgi:Lar family restriction alleviation protein
MTLLRCPFCGSTDLGMSKTEGNWPIVMCYECGTHGPCIAHTNAGAKANWNRRSDQSTSAPGSDVQEKAPTVSGRG